MCALCLQRCPTAGRLDNRRSPSWRWRLWYIFQKEAEKHESKSPVALITSELATWWTLNDSLIYQEFMVIVLCGVELIVLLRQNRWLSIFLLEQTQIFQMLSTTCVTFWGRRKFMSKRKHTKTTSKIFGCLLWKKNTNDCTYWIKTKWIHEAVSLMCELKAVPPEKRDYAIA